MNPPNLNVACTSEFAGRPVFLLGFHRGGTTFVQRLLNCHQRVTMWGENGGLVSTFRAMHRAFNGTTLDTETYVSFQDFADLFEPWASPITAETLLGRMADFVESLYCVGQRSAVWGFKEIRHGNRPDIDFLVRLFPQAGLILLVRQPRQLLNSELHVSWSPAGSMNLAKYVNRFTRAYLRTIEAFSYAANRWPDNVWIYSYEAFRDQDALEQVFSRIGVSRDEINHDLVARVRAARVGSSFGRVNVTYQPKIKC
jgi:hypothetical protein